MFSDEAKFGWSGARIKDKAIRMAPLGLPDVTLYSKLVALKIFLAAKNGIGFVAVPGQWY